MPSISEALCREMRDSFQQLFRKLRPRRRLRDIELAEESGHGWSERQGSWCEGLRRRLSQALRREQLAGVQAGNRRVQHVETDRREKVGRYEEAERRDRHCATDAERYGHLRATDAERHREDLLHEIRGVLDKIGRYVSDVGRHDVRLAFPPICDLGFLFQATRGKPADCRGDSHIGLFCPERQKSGKNASSRFSRAGEPRSGREPPRIRRTSSSRRAETEKERHLLRELVPRRGVLPQEPREAKLGPDEVFVTGAIRSKASSRRRHLLQEPREAKPSARGARNSESALPEIRTTPKATLQAPAMPRSSERTPKRR